MIDIPIAYKFFSLCEFYISQILKYTSIISVLVSLILTCYSSENKGLGISYYKFDSDTYRMFGVLSGKQN